MWGEQFYYITDYYVLDLHFPSEDEGLKDVPETYIIKVSEIKNIVHRKRIIIIEIDPPKNIVIVYYLFFTHTGRQ